MKPTVIPKNSRHLKTLINAEIKKNGNKCDLNHINVSNLTHLNYLFDKSKFNGDISKWDVSKVKDMTAMFYNSAFTGDLSDWTPFALTNTYEMYKEALLEEGITRVTEQANRCTAPIPYWVNMDKKFVTTIQVHEAWVALIKNYLFVKELADELPINAQNKKNKTKI